MPEKTYIQAQEKLEILEHLNTLYGPKKKKDFADISEDPTYYGLVERMNLPILEVVELIKSRLSFWGLFRLHDEVIINKNKLKKLKK